MGSSGWTVVSKKKRQDKKSLKGIFERPVGNREVGKVKQARKKMKSLKKAPSLLFRTRPKPENTGRLVVVGDFFDVPSCAAVKLASIFDFFWRGSPQRQARA